MCRHFIVNLYSFIADLLFVLTDLWVISVYRDFYRRGDVDVLLILEFAVFMIYPFMIHLSRRQPDFIEAHRELENKIPSLLFLLKVGHIFVFIYIPIGMMIFLTTVSGEYHGDDDVLIVIILIMVLSLPLMPILLGRAMDSETGKKQTCAENRFITRIILNIGFIIVFAFIDLTFKKLGDWLCTELTKEITNNYSQTVEPLMILQVAYTALFIWFVYIPARMWIFIPFYRDRLKMAGFILSIILLFISNVFAYSVFFNM